MNRIKKKLEARRAEAQQAGASSSGSHLGLARPTSKRLGGGAPAASMLDLARAASSKEAAGGGSRAKPLSVHGNASTSDGGDGGGGGDDDHRSSGGGGGRHATEGGVQELAAMSSRPPARVVVGVRMRPRLAEELSDGVAWRTADGSAGGHASVLECVILGSADADDDEEDSRGADDAEHDEGLGGGGRARGNSSMGEGGNAGAATAGNRSSSKKKQARFNFEKVFGPNVGNEEIFEELALPILDRALEGYSGTVFAYGQTGSGKTHTLLGEVAGEGDGGPESATLAEQPTPQPGLIPLFAHELFTRLSSVGETDSNAQSLVRLSYLEIYNEQLRDLLAPSSKAARAEGLRRFGGGKTGAVSMRPSSKGSAGTKLSIKDDAVRGVRVSGLREVVVSTPAAVMQLIAKGELERRYGATLMNARSSRSHTVVQLVIECRRSLESAGDSMAVETADVSAHLGVHPANSAGRKSSSSGSPRNGRARSRSHAEQVARISDVSPAETTHVLHAVVNLVDLAGSERVKRSGATGAALREAGNINKSLLALGNVVAELSREGRHVDHAQPLSGEMDKHHVPYRDSKLTRLLQASLGGNALTAIVATVSPTALSREETRNTLSFATRARNVVNRAVQWVQVTDEASLLVQYQREIFDLRAQLRSAHEQLQLSAALSPAIGVGATVAAGMDRAGGQALVGGGSSLQPVHRRGNSGRGRIASVMIDPSTVKAMREIGFLHSQRIGEEGEEESRKEGGMVAGVEEGSEVDDDDNDDDDEEEEEEEIGSARRASTAALLSGALERADAMAEQLRELREELVAERAARAVAEARVAELEHEVEGGGVEGARQRMVGAMEVATLKEQLAAANSRAVKAEALVAGARAEAAEQKSLASQLNRVLQTMQTRETNRAASEALDAKVQGVLGRS